MKKYALFLCIFIAIISIVIFYKASVTQRFNVNKHFNVNSSVEHPNHIFDPSFFIQAYFKGEQYKKTADEQIFGGITPHHLLAAPLIAGFFEGIANQKINTIILLAPNHYDVGKNYIQTSKGYWETLFGNLSTNLSDVTTLVNDKSAYVNESVFDNEHAIYGITPFIKKTFPHATFVPIIIKSQTPKADLDKLVSSLYKIDNEHTMVIASVDFSHYMDSDQADAHDKVSISAIESFNLNKVLSLSDVKNFNSPESIYTLLKLMQLKYTNNPVLIENTNSAKLTAQSKLQSTTSYLTMYFTKESSENKLSTDSMFTYVDPAQASIKNTNPDEYTIIATGDVIPARSVNAKLVQSNDFDYPFKKTVGFLKSADAVFINLESPLTPNCPLTLQGMTFCGDLRDVQGLKFAGVAVANLANNHAGNYGINGVNSTINILKRNKIQVTGTDNQPAIIMIKGKRFGFLGYNSIGQQEAGIAWADIPKLQQDIKSLKKKVDFVIVTFHWGIEYTDTPNSTQIQLAHAAIDAGADLIIGNHPHWVQGVEKYKGKFITYAHGNFVFDQTWSQATQEGVLGKYTFNKSGLISIQFIPIIINNYQPRFATEAEANSILKNMRESSSAISQEIASTQKFSF